MSEFTGTYSGGSQGEIHEFLIPEDRKWVIEAAGARGGGSHGGRGALVSVILPFSVGDKIRLSVGHSGVSEGEGHGSGGGGTFVGLVNPAPQNSLSILYLQRNVSPEPYDTSLIDLLESRGLSVSVEMGSLDAIDLFEYDVLIVGAPGEGYTEHVSSSIISSSPIPVVSLCRHTSRNALGMSSSSGGGSNVTSFQKSEYWDPVWIDEQVLTGDSSVPQRIDSLSPGVGRIYSTNDPNDVGLAYWDDTGFIKTHCSFFRFDLATEEFKDLFLRTLPSWRDEFQLLIAAGGGGANDHEPDFRQEHGRISTSGGEGIQSGDGGVGIPGENGQGGTGDSTALGGAGYFGGNDGNALGGLGRDGCTQESLQGGFGGGGSSAGSGWGRCAGGGGYSGGAGARGSEWSVAGGGGSYAVDDFNEALEGGNQEEHGWVRIYVSTRVKGTVRDENGNPCQRAVYVMSRPTDGSVPELLAHGLSDPVTGEYELAANTGLEVTRIVIAEDQDSPGPNDPVLPDLVDRVIPE